jgi:hypothetical protein
MISRIRRGTRSITFCLTFLSMFLFSTPIPAQRSRTPVPQKREPTQQEDSVPAVLVMRVDDDRITADIRNSPLQKALRELAERTGIVFEVRSEDNPLVSVHLYGVSFQEAIQRIASDNNTIFFYDKNKPTRIAYVRVFPRANSVEQPSIIYLGTGAVTKSNDDIDTPEQALRILAENASPKVRKKAIEILSQTASVEAIEALLKSVSDPEAKIRIAAIEGLAALGVHEALSGILKSLKDPDPGVRQSAITAIALLGDESNLRDLEPLKMDDDAGVAAAAETAVQKLSVSLEE